MPDLAAPPSPIRLRVAARRRRQCGGVIAVVLVAGFWVGPPQEARTPVVGSGADARVQTGPVSVQPVEPDASGEVSEVRPTDLVQSARDRGEPSPPLSSGSDDFVTPSGNILCAYAGGQLDCHIGSGLAPPPTSRCPDGTGDWAGIRLGPRGPSAPWCTNVRLEDRTPPELELAYGSRWARDGLACTSQRDGLRCMNEDGGELLLSRATTQRGPRLTEEPPRLDSLADGRNQHVEEP